MQQIEEVIEVTRVCGCTVGNHCETHTHVNGYLIQVLIYLTVLF